MDDIVTMEKTMDDIVKSLTHFFILEGIFVAFTCLFVLLEIWGLFAFFALLAILGPLWLSTAALLFILAAVVSEKEEAYVESS